MMKAFYVLITVLSFAPAALAEELVLQPGAEGKDAMVSIIEPGVNYGNGTHLMVNFGPGTQVQGFVQFEGLAAISGATVNTAYLDLWIDSVNQTDYDFGIYRVTAAWEESTVTWNNRPDHVATPYDTIQVSGAVGGPYTWDAQELVQEWLAGTYVDYGLLLKRVDIHYPSNWPYFCSSDHANASYRPRLTVDYNPPAVSPASMGSIKTLFR
jgi:hypothetical protein